MSGELLCGKAIIKQIHPAHEWKDGNIPIVYTCPGFQPQRK